MAPKYLQTLYQNNAGSSLSTVTATSTAASSKGSLGILVGRCSSAGPPANSTITDSVGNVWTLDKTAISASAAGVYLYSAPLLVPWAVGTTVQVTFSTGIINRSVIVAEFAQANITSARLDITGSNATTSSVTSLSATLPAQTSYGDLIIGAVATSTSQTSFTTAFSTPQMTDVTYSGLYCGLSWKVGDRSSISPTELWAAPGSVGFALAAYRPTFSGGLLTGSET